MYKHGLLQTDQPTMYQARRFHDARPGVLPQSRSDNHPNVRISTVPSVRADRVGMGGFLDGIYPFIVFVCVCYA